jgi:hypothetical protein
MVIIWRDRPRQNDTHLVSMVWFDKQKPTHMFYAIEGSNHAHHASVREVEQVMSEELYAQSVRAKEAL